MDYQKVKELIDLIDGTDVTEVEVESNGVRIKVVRGSKQAPIVMYGGAPMAAAPQAGREEEPEGDEDSNLRPIPATMVGVFYRASSPETDPFVQVGQEVRKGDTVCIIEAMKMMNQIESDKAGRITSVMVQNGEPVEFGQPLFTIE